MYPPDTRELFAGPVAGCLTWGWADTSDTQPRDAKSEAAAYKIWKPHPMIGGPSPEWNGDLAKRQANLAAVHEALDLIESQLLVDELKRQIDRTQALLQQLEAVREARKFSWRRFLPEAVAGAVRDLQRAPVEAEGVASAIVTSTLLRRLHNPRGRECGCVPECFCQRNSLGRLVRWYLPRGVHKSVSPESKRRLDHRR
jgi:hypothetical protein